jgi:hypothetical protein
LYESDFDRMVKQIGHDKSNGENGENGKA